MVLMKRVLRNHAGIYETKVEVTVAKFPDLHENQVVSDEDRRNPNRTATYQFKAVRAYALGCCPGGGGSFSSRIFHRPLLPLPTCAALGDADPRLYLCADGQRKHQRGRAQFHS